MLVQSGERSGPGPNSFPCGAEGPITWSLFPRRCKGTATASASLSTGGALHQDGTMGVVMGRLFLIMMVQSPPLILFQAVLMSSSEILLAPSGNQPGSVP